LGGCALSSLMIAVSDDGGEEIGMKAGSAFVDTSVDAK
jgi:hypothetical protein